MAEGFLKSEEAPECMPPHSSGSLLKTGCFPSPSSDFLLLHYLARSLSPALSDVIKTSKESCDLATLRLSSRPAPGWATWWTEEGSSCVRSSGRRVQEAREKEVTGLENLRCGPGSLGLQTLPSGPSPSAAVPRPLPDASPPLTTPCTHNHSGSQRAGLGSADIFSFRECFPWSGKKCRTLTPHTEGHQRAVSHGSASVGAPTFCGPKVAPGAQGLSNSHLQSASGLASDFYTDQNCCII